MNKVKRFGRGCITEEEYYYLYNFVKQNNIKNIVEFGPGTSTFAFLETDPHINIVTLETSRKWKKYYDAKFQRYRNIKVVLFKNGRQIRLPKGCRSSFEMAFVDGPPARGETKGPARMQACEFCENITNLIMFHDAEREGERKTLEIMKEKGWKVKFAPVKNENIGICYNGSYVFPGEGGNNE